MIMDYEKAKKDVFQELELIHKTFEPGLAKALWDVNLTQLSSSLKGMANLPTIGKILLFESSPETSNIKQNPILEFSKRGADIRQNDDINNVLKSNINYSFDGSSATIGEIVIYVDHNGVFGRVKQGYIIIVITAVIKSIILWIIFLWFSRRLLHLPLTKLTEQVVALDLDTENNSNIDLGVKGQTELNILQSSFNHMVTRLKKSRKLLKQNNIILEEKVTQRTAQLENKNNELQLVNKKLEEASTTDSLTGFRNRRYLSEHIQFDIELALRQFNNQQYNQIDNKEQFPTDLVFYFIDIDNFAFTIADPNSVGRRLKNCF